MSRCSVLMTKFPCLQEMPPSEPVEQGDEGVWDTVGESQRSPHCRRALGADGAPTPCCSGEHGTRRCCYGRGSGHRGAGGGACRGGTGRHRQYSRRPNRDGSPVELVSVDSSRVVLDVVVILIDNRLVYSVGNRRTCPGRGMNPLQRWRKKKPRRSLRSPLPPLRRSPRRRPLRLRCPRPASLKVTTLSGGISPEE
jgi:hypothetical protein